MRILPFFFNQVTMSSNVKVAVRLRPLDEGKKEKWANGMEIHGRRIVLGPRTFDPDITLDVSSTQSDVFDTCIPILDSVRNGSNGTILVYGQTGTGKTHTMLGPDNSSLSATSADRGVTVRAIEYLLQHVTERVLLGSRAALSLSMLEIYNERITDMLLPDQPLVPLYGGFPHSATKEPLASTDQAIHAIVRGLSYRHVTQTAMNDRSSRSHVIIMLHLEEQQDGSEEVDVARLFLVDLAGSESIKKSQVAGKAAGEAGVINKSLLALKGVVMALSNGNGEQRGHIPYRDSRLTEVLQDSIGGSARTMMIACISPVGRDVEETKSTLDYASKARTIRNIANTERDKMAIRIRSLEMDLQKHRNQLQDKINERNGVWVPKDAYERYLTLEDTVQEFQNDVVQMSRQLVQAEARRNIVESQVQIFKHAAQRKEEELEHFRRAQVDVITKFEQAETRLRLYFAQVMSDVASAVEADSASARDRLEEFKDRDLDVNAAVTMVGAQIDGICNRINTQVRYVVDRLQAQHRDVLDELLATDERESKDMADAVAQIQESLSAVMSIRSAAASRHATTRSASEEILTLIAGAPPCADADSIRSVVRDTVETIQGSIDTLFVPSSASAVVATAQMARMAMSRYSRGPMLDGIQALSAIPPRVPSSPSSPLHRPSTPALSHASADSRPSTQLPPSPSRVSARRALQPRRDENRPSYMAPLKGSKRSRSEADGRSTTAGGSTQLN